jgi:hypothetical protein
LAVRALHGITQIRAVFANSGIFYSMAPTARFAQARVYPRARLARVQC